MNINRERPIAAVKPKVLSNHGKERVDNYYWMNERENPEVVDYLNGENSYYKEMTKHTESLQKSLFSEMKARIKEDDSSVPYLYNGYYYITRFEKDRDYPIYSRKKESLEAAEEIMFNCNEMAEGHTFFHLRGVNVSEDNQWVAYGIDTVSRREYTLYIKNLITGVVLKTAIENTTGSSVWASDNKTLFYSRKDEVTLRSDKIFKHTLHSDVTRDSLVFYEEDETYSTFIYKEKSRKFLVIGSESTLTSEYRILEADNPNGDFRVFQPRVRGLEYGITHYENAFYVMTNKDDAYNFKLMKTGDEHTEMQYWTELIAHRADTLLEGIDVFKNYLVVSERINGLPKIKIQPWDSSEEAYYLPFESETYTAYTGANVDFETEILRYAYQSLKTPSSILDFNMRTREQVVMKEQEVIGTFDKENYIEERVWAKAKDGVKVPISLIYKKGIQKDSTNPLLLYGYGAYGATMEAYFSTIRLSLLNRGFIYAIAHVRGGEDLGRDWYEHGKLFNKKNTFQDFIDCSEFLIEEKYTSASHLYAEGGSAGGLLMGVVANEAGELYNGLIVQVPFVDVLTTMLDDTIPLTTGEYDEWGNPNIEEFYTYIESYSPYDNVKETKYPNMYITTGLHDSQVQYWEPAKWVAKLRALKTNNTLLLFETNMETGHGGASGRFEALKEVAKEYAFLLDLEGIRK